jgi:hypothetical protein
MTNWYGMLGLSDTSRVFGSTEGQIQVYNAATAYIDQVNMQLAEQMTLLVSETTTNHIERYRLPGGGRLQRRGINTQTGATRASGYWDVAYPLEDFGDQKAWTDVDRGYMTMADFNLQMEDVIAKDIATVRYEMLKPLFNNTAPRTFSDRIWGDISLVPLAAGESGILYPPISGSETEATENLYYGTNYVASSISDSNNPITGIVAKLEDHFGESQGGERIVVFVKSGSTAVTKIKALTNFVDANIAGVTYGANQSTVDAGSLPNVPGRIIGYVDGAYISEWRWMPAEYLLGIHMDAPAPLKMRVDPADTGLGTGLQLVATDERYPITSSHFRHRFGFGVANRLNGVVVQLVASTSYTIPTAYA